ncbi:hypothetical protein ACN23B_14525 [Anabaena sp. FACHB-709]|uniref:Uncharacterized protein n=1 Tax=Anabaena cylindrica FACHB-318 TaxID=2692880 RepID=A0ABR7ZGZ5_ANACY|nr:MULTISPECIES: hypothetical protein [Nostocaceae]MBD2171667.1 hypothetical protein [Anabaena cylindrica FACHB-318]MBD2264186.1 hypothetical protein [Anabaena sp. FACHB-709]MBD2273529.1 hypothetical protein [Nostoc sp. PCC 7120 = FACHB-418]MBD2281730.1 hypothetical protein [Anabaena cylindrica FACHB-170]MBD2347558.1 hypothetical protein [Trichormus variabilis FACHB-171]
MTLKSVATARNLPYGTLCEGAVSVFATQRYRELTEECDCRTVNSDSSSPSPSVFLGKWTKNAKLAELDVGKLYSVF